MARAADGSSAGDWGRPGAVNLKEKITASRLISLTSVIGGVILLRPTTF
ncbi:hypothetical protein ABZ707_06470 [Streptomyces sp. NPDC006923]